MLSDKGFTPRDYIRFGIEQLRQVVSDVQVWDCNCFLSNYRTIDASAESPGVPHLHFQAEQELRKALATADVSTLVLWLMGKGLRASRILRDLARRGMEYVVFTGNTVPMSMAANVGIWNRIRSQRLASTVDAAVSRVPLRWRGANPAAFVIAGGRRSLEASTLVASSTRVVWAHSMDYDLCLRENLLPADAYDERPSAVFLDEFVPYHPDYIVNRLRTPVTADEYYPSLCRFFDDLERKLNLSVVIAAHPKARYENSDSRFGGRPVLFGQTAGLVRRSKLVIAHSSTAISFGVLFKKPMVFVTSKPLQDSWLGEHIALMARLLGQRPIRVDDSPIEWPALLQFDDRRYLEYQHDYIKTEGSADQPIWRALAEVCGMTPS